jgi:hypothetical protein
MATDTFHFGFTAAASITDRALCTLFNAEGSDLRRELELVQLTIREVPFPASMSGALVGTVELVRISSQAGGTAVSPVATNTAATLPTQVSCRTQVDAIELSGMLRSSWLNEPGIGVTSGGLATWLPGVGAKNPGQPCRNTGAVWQAGQGAVLQSLELAEGEGIAIRPSATPPAPLGWLCDLELDVGTSSWVVPAELFPSEGHHAWITVFNGVGSGTVLKIRAIHAFTPGFYSYDNSTSGVASENSTLRLVRVRRATGGTLLNPQPASTRNTVPAALQLRRGSLRNELTIQLVEGLDPIADLGYPGTNAPAVRRLQTFRNARLRVASVDVTTGFAEGNFAPARSLRQGWEVRSNLPVAGLRLRPQEGLALLVNSASPLCSYIVEGTILHQAPPSAVAGSRRPVARFLGA